MPRSAGHAQGPLPLWRRPLTLIFRAHREAPPAAAPNWRGADGERVTLAPRLQFALHFWTLQAARHHHYDASPPQLRRAAVAAAQIPDSPHLHFHRDGARGRDGAVGLPQREPEARMPIPESVGRTGYATAPMVLRAASLTIGTVTGPRAGAARGVPAASRQRGASPVPVPAGVKIGMLALASKARAVRRASLGSGGQGSAAGTGGRGGGHTEMSHPRQRRAMLAAVGHGAAPLPDRRRSSAAPATRSGGSFAPAAMEFAAAPQRRNGRPADSAPDRPLRPETAAAELEYRRQAPTVPESESASPPRPAPPPAPPTIDLDALSREVIERIEKRLRIERERHGRI